MTNITIYHNPNCTKSRLTLALLEEKGIAPKIVQYLKDSPDEAEIKNIFNKLGAESKNAVRKGEVQYKEFGLSADSTENEIIAAIAKAPKLLERPIVVNNAREKAAIGRPPENVLAIL